jgi:hypothetical protein
MSSIFEIVDLVHEHGAVLATGHTTAEEHFAVVKAFADRVPVLVTHAGEMMAGPRLSAAQAAELGSLGATVELTAQVCKTVHGVPGKSPDDMVAMIRTIGSEHCTLSTDYGWTNELPHPAPGLGEYLDLLWAAGISEDELTMMARTTPARLLGLELTA